MTIQEIKNRLTAENTNGQFTSLQMVQQKDTESGELQPWFSHWCNASRTRVTMHEDVFTAIKANTSINTLVLKDREIISATADRAAYSRYIVVIPTNIAAVF